MVRKVEGNRPAGTAGATPVQPSKTVESAKVGGVEQVREAQGKGGVGAVRTSTRVMTAEQQEHLFHMIDEEAERLFGKSGLPESKKKTVTGAVKMAIGAGLLEDEEEE